MKKLLTILILLTWAGAVCAAWMSQRSASNGVTPVTIQAAPASGKSRTVSANGGITVYNSASTAVTFTVWFANTAISQAVQTVTLPSSNTWDSNLVRILDGTTNTLELTGATPIGAALKIITNYRDETQ
jgi:hypothetical protein